MSVTKPIASFKDSLSETARAYHYGFSSWCYFVTVSAISVGFFVTQYLVNGVRGGSIEMSSLDATFYPGVYWTIATSAMLFLIFAMLFLGISIALLVVRAWMHTVPCRIYGLMLLLQIAPWAYFATSF